MSTYLVIRCSGLDGVNPVDEVDRVIDRCGFCWFGKYGQPINSIGNKLKTGQLQVVLAGGSKIDMVGTGALYSLLTWSFSPPSPEHYPTYYASKLGRISTWLKLQRAEQPVIATNDLVIKSSLLPLAKALNDSMRGHFWCKVAKPQP